MPNSDLVTNGVSPKTIAATLTAPVVAVVLALLTKLIPGFELDVDTATAIVGPLLLAVATGIATYRAKPGDVIRLGEAPSPVGYDEEGYEVPVEIVEEPTPEGAIDKVGEEKGV